MHEDDNNRCAYCINRYDRPCEYCHYEVEEDNDKS